MKELDDWSKDIIYWKFIEEKSNEEIEILLWISNDNVRQKLSRAIKQLKSRLESHT
jgi:DNA-directed RNA polymerase specialized sigma subunit